MSILDSLITDRAVPGRYDWRDFNRVEEAVAYVAAILRSHGCDAKVTVKTDWNRGDTLSWSDAERYAGNIKILRDALIGFTETPPVPETIRFLTYQTANDIEKILLDIDDAVERMKKTFVPCGTATCGGDNL